MTSVRKRVRASSPAGRSAATILVEHARARPARRLADHRDRVGVAAERRDVLPDPLERRDLVQQTECSRARAIPDAEVAGGVQTVVQGDRHDAVASERGTVVDGVRAGSVLEAAAMDPDEHGIAVAPRSGVHTLRFRQSSPWEGRRRWFISFALDGVEVLRVTGAEAAGFAARYGDRDRARVGTCRGHGVEPPCPLAGGDRCGRRRHRCRYGRGERRRAGRP